jgi:transcriptional regulator GlxA family with amidase domain
MSERQPPVTVAILVFPDTSASVVYGIYDLFMSAGRDWGYIVSGVPGEQLMQPLLVAASADTITVGNGVRIAPHTTFARCPAVDIVCVPEVNVPPGTDLAEPFAIEIDWLKARFDAGATLATACSGAMLLAEAGLLNGLEATTHWAWCDALRRKFPKVEVHEQRALVATGEGQRLVMAGGGTSWLDLTLYLIARSVGVDAAMEVARINLIDWHQVGQQPFARLARTRQVDDRVIGRCQSWIAEHYDEPAPVAAMVRLSGLPERSFKRRFKEATGMAPLDYVHTLRIEEAKQMLEATSEPIEAIANQVGYEDPGFFGRLFKRKVNLSPARYRKRFGSMRSLLAEARASGYDRPTRAVGSIAMAAGSPPPAATA